MAQDIYAPLEGKLVAIDKITGTFRKCVGCDHTTAKVSVRPIGMHHGHLTCQKCGRLTSYLGRDHLAALLAAHSSENGEAA